MQGKIRKKKPISYRFNLQNTRGMISFLNSSENSHINWCNIKYLESIKGERHLHTPGTKPLHTKYIFYFSSLLFSLFRYLTLPFKCLSFSTFKNVSQFSEKMPWIRNLNQYRIEAKIYIHVSVYDFYILLLIKWSFYKSIHKES